MNEKKGMFKCIGLMWKRCFDYKGTSGLGEFWLPFAFNGIIGVLAAGSVIAALFSGITVFSIIAIVLLGYDIVSILPFVALTVRRLRDTGRSGWWSLLALVVGAGTVVVLMMCACSSMFISVGNINADVYGPPYEIIDDFDPSINEQECIYGPPEMFEDDADVDDNEPDFDPGINEIQCIYGPPEMFEDGNGYDDNQDASNGDSKDEKPSDDKKTDGNSEDNNDNEKPSSLDANTGNMQENSNDAAFDEDPGFDALFNEPECIYGPPEMFED